ncbi:(Fe-S)-binding protein [Desulfatitalea alkaliphila]|uniref:(Fe-S)-binding protein n=1 Tax=Desulfatitalea alkaliphila TaxID=2929485 RepID=A0AA41R5K5_9BACT|nr:(Fe-S)-binding protein [Desulfatitalea alkaliphila]MCJ8502207.1 (Fe-S)-binding protein [Desulfatitalea alkaliphila]
MVAKSYIDGFVPEGRDDRGCVNCGVCLQRCPVMKMGKAESKLEMGRLLDGERPQRVLDECTFCYSCNSFCPQGLRPYNLIMERMTAENRQSGRPRPKALDYMMTGKGESGYFFDQYKAAPSEDQAILDRWSAVPPRAKEVLFIGCFGRTIPQRLEHSKTLATLPKFGPREACCGEIPHRFGDYDYFSELVGRTQRTLERLECERLVCYCGSCSNYLGNVWPKDHGVQLPFAVISLYEWLWEKLSAGELAMARRFDKEIAISDSCYGSELGSGFYTAIRGLYQAAGMKTVELADHHENALCCGFACGIRNNYDQSLVGIQGQKKLDEILATGMRAVGVNCPGCWAGISGAAKAANQELKVRFAISDFLWAFGDDPPAKAQ